MGMGMEWRMRSVIGVHNWMLLLYDVAGYVYLFISF